jgi:xanthine dehydrogenase YagT iron-sulfur-binding subunit
MPKNRDRDPPPPTGTKSGGSEDLSPVGAARRDFLRRSGLLTTGVATLHYAPVSGAAVPAPTAGPGTEPHAILVKLIVNGHPYELILDPRVTLLDALREHVALTGTKKGCDRGQCGACTVLVDDRRINACLALAASYDGARITTIEGLAEAGALHPVQAAFVRHDGFQCGFCTPGQICSAIAMLKEAAAGVASAVTADVRNAMPALTDDEIRERMSGNLCRCGAYVGIVAAIGDVARSKA